MAEELIYKVGVEGTNELNKLEQSVDKAGKSVGKTKLYMSELRTELRKARGDMIKYAEGTEEYNRALAKGSRITTQINDANSKMRAGVQDIGTTTRNVTGAMVGMAGGFQVVQSAMSLFGIENEETIKTVLKLQQTMAIVQGMARFAQGISNAQNLVASFRATNHQLNEDLKTTGDGMEGVSKSSDKMGDSFKTSGKESAVLGSNLAGNTKISNDLKDSLGNLSKEQLLNTKSTIEAAIKSEEAHRAVLETKLEAAKLDKTVQGATRHWTEEIEKSNKALGDHQAKLDGVNTRIEDLGKKGPKAVSTFAKSIGKSLLTMSAFLAVIALVTWGISELIK